MLRRIIAFFIVSLVVVGAARAETYGPPTPGICFLTKARVLDQSAAGSAANRRMALFTRGVEQELRGERAAIIADANVLQIQKPVISEAVYQQRAGALALRQQSFQTLESTRNEQLANTRAKANARLIRELAPVLAAVLSEHGCSAVLESSGAYAYNPAMDLTAEIIRVMDARLPAVAFDLEPSAR